MYIHTYIHSYIHTYTYIHTYMHIHTYTHIHIYIHTYIYTYIHTYIHTHIHTYIHTYIHTHTHIIYIHTYIIVILTYYDNMFPIYLLLRVFLSPAVHKYRPLIRILVKATNLANEIQQWSCMSGHTKVRPGNVMILPDFFGLTSDSLKNILLSDQGVNN